MNKYPAHLLLNIGSSLSHFPSDEWEPLRYKTYVEYLFQIADDFRKIECINSQLMAIRLAREAEQVKPEEIIVRSAELKDTLFEEAKRKLFLKIPDNRAPFFSKTALSLLGKNCMRNFSSIKIEVEEAMRCYACGRFTSCAFHMMRACEKGIEALAKAAKIPLSNNNWGRFFAKFDKALADYHNPAITPKTAPWDAHGDFLEEVAPDLRAVKGAWRNKTMHLEKSYNESQAAYIVNVIPQFIKEISKEINENGQWI